MEISGKSQREQNVQGWYGTLARFTPSFHIHYIVFNNRNQYSIYPLLASGFFYWVSNRAAVVYDCALTNDTVKGIENLSEGWASRLAEIARSMNTTAVQPKASSPLVVICFWKYITRLRGFGFFPFKIRPLTGYQTDQFLISQKQCYTNSKYDSFDILNILDGQWVHQTAMNTSIQLLFWDYER